MTERSRPAPDGSSAGPVDRVRLDALLGVPELAWLRGRVRRRLAQGSDVTGVTVLQDPSAGQRDAVDRLLGRRPSTGSSVSVSLDDVDAMLRSAGICDGLAVAVEVLGGPVVDVADRTRRVEAAWDHLYATMAPAGPGSSWRTGWRDDLASTGLLRRLADEPVVAGRLVERADLVLDALPAGAIGRARLAAATLGDSHALDDGRPVTTLVLKAMQHRFLPVEERGVLPTGTDRRALWAAGGVLLDELSAPVLVLGLSSSDVGPVGTSLRAHASVGEPVRLTLRELLRHPPDLAALDGSVVRACENPAVVAAAADELGGDSAPVVCTDGWPSAAAQTLLRMVRDAGATVAHHGDFDRGGVRIADMMVRRFGASPWRFDVAAYRAAPAGPPLSATVPSVRWAPGLAEAMADRGVAVHEEQVLGSLLADLARRGRA